MKMLWKLSIALFFFQNTLFSQDVKNQIYIPSPDAAALARYCEIPVNNYTGIPNISIPIFTINENDFPIDISLSYHGGGLKAVDEASCVGLGWTLNAGGVVTRSIRGLPDEASSKGYAEISQDKRDLIERIALHGVNFSDSENAEGMVVNRNDAYSFFFDPYNEGKLDIYPDSYSFNFMGFSGSFTLDKKGNPVVQTSSNVELIRFSSGANEILFRDAHGFYYRFAAIEKILVNKGYNDTFDRLHPSSWFLTEIYFMEGELSSNPKHLIAEFIYGEYTDRLEFWESWRSSQNLPPLFGAGVIGPYVWDETGYYYETEVDVLAGKVESGLRYHRNIYDKLLVINEINTRNKRIKFVSNSTKREDTGLNNRVDDIMIYDKRKGSNINLIKHYRFGYGYFYDQDPSISSVKGSKLRLIDVKLVSTENPMYTEPYYSFDYFRPQLSLATPEPTSYYYMPRSDTHKYDYWGYINRSPSETVSSALPFTSGMIYADSLYGSPNSSYMRYASKAFAPTGVLTKITYPTGGSTVFNWACNTYSYIKNEKKLYEDPYCRFDENTKVEKLSATIYANGHAPGNISESFYLEVGKSIEITTGNFYPDDPCVNPCHINCSTVRDIYYGCHNWNDDYLNAMVGFETDRMPIVYLAPFDTPSSELTYEKLSAVNQNITEACNKIKRAVIPFDYINNPSKAIVLNAPEDGYYKVGVIPGYILPKSFTYNNFYDINTTLGEVIISYDYQEPPSLLAKDRKESNFIGTAGGIRIGSISEIDSKGRLFKSQIFDYNMVDKEGNLISSGVLNNEPKYDFEFLSTVKPVSPENAIPLASPSIKHSARNLSITMTQGSCVGYSQVTIVDKFGGQVIRNYTTAKEYPDINENANPGVKYLVHAAEINLLLTDPKWYEIMFGSYSVSDTLTIKLGGINIENNLASTSLLTSLDYRRGILQSEKIIDVKGQVIKETAYEYIISNDLSHFIPGELFVTFFNALGTATIGNDFLLGKYRFIPNQKYLYRTIEQEYYSNDTVVNTSKYEYCGYSATNMNDDFPISITTHSSTKKDKIQRMNYHGHIMKPYQVLESIGGKVVSAKMTDYVNYFPMIEYDSPLNGLDLADDGSVCVSNGYDQKIERSYAFCGDYETGVFFKRNLIEEKCSDGTVYSFLYDNNDWMRVVVKGVGALQLESIVSNSNVGNVEQVKDAISLAFPNAEITIANYNKFGVASKTDTNGISTYFDYDDFGRLISVKDSNGDIIKSFSYYYKK